MPMTITEALAEIKTIGKRLDKKREAVVANIGRDSRLKDPLADGNGSSSVTYLAQERQAINDLEKRIVAIRTAIQKSNLETPCTVGASTMPVQDWLNFRREISTGRQGFLQRMNMSIRNIRQQAQAKGGRVVMAGAVSQASVTTGDNPPVEIVLHVDEKSLLEEQEGLEQTLGELDGKLSLLNATTVIEV
jgi:hypothetical protein